jgi:LAO/AO transport system kinase
MNDLATDPGIFIRSMATRGALGGLSPAAGDAIDLMSAAGRSLILIETVGVGQDEVEIIRLAHTIVVVNVPGLGDEIQALKAGIMEIADIHVVNKADRQGFNRTMAEIKTAMAMSQHTAGGWNPPVLACVATREEGAAVLLDEIARHMGHLRSSGELRDRELRTARARVSKIAGQITARLVEAPIGQLGEDSSGEIALVARRELSPYAGARLLLARAAAAGRTSSDA